LFILYHYLEQNLHFGLVPEPPQVLSARSFLVAGFDTLNIPRSFSCGIGVKGISFVGLDPKGWLRLVGSIKL